MLRYLAEIGILLHPSLHEQSGYVVLEAMAAGRLVLCLASGSLAALVGDDSGVRVSITNPEQVVAELAQGLLQLASDPKARRRIGQAVRARVRGLWAWERVWDRLLGVHDELDGATPSSSIHHTMYARQ